MNQFYFDNSSLNEIACGRRYLYRCVRGLNQPPVEAFASGALFHAMMRDITPSDTEVTLMLPGMGGERWQAERQNVTVDKQNSCAILAVRARDALDLYNLPGLEREMWFEFSGSDIGAHPAARICGTIDVRSTRSDGFLLTDYKTTSKPITADSVRAYVLSSQMPFYAMAIRHIFNPRATIYARYVFANLATTFLVVQEPWLVTEDRIEHITKMVREKSQLAALYHEHPETAYPDGGTFGHCRYCSFGTLCEQLSHGSRELAALNWPHGHAPYNPSLFGKEKH